VPFFLLVILGTLAVVNASRNERKKMLAKAAATGARNVVFATHVDGLGIGYGTNCDLYLFDNQIVIVPKIGAKFVLDLSNESSASNPCLGIFLYLSIRSLPTHPLHVSHFKRSSSWSSHSDSSSSLIYFLFLHFYISTEKKCPL